MSVSDVDRIINHNGYDKYVGIRVKHQEKGHVILELPITSSLLNKANIVHGGVIAGLLDTVIAVTIRTLVEQPLVTVNLNISYLAPVKEDEKLEATAKILNRGYKLVTAEGEVFNDRGEVIAKAIGTFKIMSKK